MIDKGRPNHPIEKGGIDLSILKGYNLFYNHQKKMKRTVKETRSAFVCYIIFKLM